MTSSIDTFNFSKNTDSLTIINNASKLSSFEKKNMAILILARYKLAFFVKQNKEDKFINKLYDWLQNNVIDFREIDIAFTTYHNAPEGSNLQKGLFKIVKPLEELAVYLSKIATMNNDIKNKEIDIDNTMLIKAFVLNLLSYWFNRLLPIDLKKQTYYFKEILDFDFENELKDFKDQFEGFGFRNKNKSNNREQINIMYDSSIEIAEEIFKYSYKISSIPVRGVRKKKIKR